ncbi:MAG: hypothetical protein KAQ87_02855 [Candidatus Pacebacteria bacterium]|nr:hypothetical protein [Candidatus Paceibacterota bacterium]
MSKKKKLVIVVAVLVIAVAGAMGSCVYTKWQMSKEHSVVYLSTGEIYIGKLSYLSMPKFKLTNAYRLQAVKDATDETKTNFQLTPLKDTLYSPKKLYLNPDQVVFYGPIEEGSSAGEALRDAGK